MQLIRDRTSPDQWNYVQTRDNPADDASRGLEAQELVNNTRWWNGPDFLWMPRHDKPTLNFVVSPEDPEVKKISVLTTSAAERSTVLQCVERFSNWHRAKRVIAICLLFVDRMKHRSKEDVKVPSGSQERRAQCPDNAKSSRETVGSIVVSAEDLQKAEQRIIKAIQHEAFTKEVELLRSAQHRHERKDRARKGMTRSSSIYRLDPFLDEYGILRVGGRIEQADLPYEMKHPVILPKRSHITELIIRHFHQRTRHQGRTRTQAEIRTCGFWIVKGSSTVGHHVSKCVTCRKLRATTQQQKMAPLPNDRLEEAPPFTYCAVDYFGPWYIKEGRKEMKRYGVIFTCMVSRAIHLETAVSLSTDSFLNAYRRFIGRRGPVQQLRSDQGTNFVGAKNELESALLEMNHDAIQRELLKDGCDWINWKMNVPQASHMGGVWERLIRTTRSVLSAMLQNHGKQLDDESLRTLMVETEAIINGRPLTTIDLTGPDALDVLTPNRLLTMKSSVVMAPPGNFQQADAYSRKRWRRVQHLSNEFWYKWRRTYLQSLQSRQKWSASYRNLKVGDLVILKDDNIPRNCWKLARVAETYPDEDGLVRKVKVAVANQSGDGDGSSLKGSRISHLDRPVQKLLGVPNGSFR